VRTCVATSATTKSIPTTSTGNFSVANRTIATTSRKRVNAIGDIVRKDTENSADWKENLTDRVTGPPIESVEKMARPNDRALSGGRIRSAKTAPDRVGKEERLAGHLAECSWSRVKMRVSRRSKHSNSESRQIISSAYRL